MYKVFTIWVISESGLTGTENQCLGIAEALSQQIPNSEIIVKRIRLRWPTRLWSPYLSWGEGLSMLDPQHDTITPPYPDLVIAGGRKSIGPARFIRQNSKGKTLVCLVQNPKVKLDDFDLVAAPRHDHLIGPNVLTTQGAPNRITPAGLETARLEWADQLGTLPGPRLAVLIGGNSKTHRLGTRQMDDIITHLKQRQSKDNASLMITISRRTPSDLAQRLVDSFQITDPETKNKKVYIYTGQGKNPYLGFLAWADYIICTTDSTSMISEAATTGKPIDLIHLPGSSKRHRQWMEHLKKSGIGIDCHPYTPFNDAQMVAEALQKLLFINRQKEQ